MISDHTKLGDTVMLKTMTNPNKVLCTENCPFPSIVMTLTVKTTNTNLFLTLNFDPKPNHKPNLNLKSNVYGVQVDITFLPVHFNYHLKI